jgi:hypothetical protein
MELKAEGLILPLLVMEKSPLSTSFTFGVGLISELLSY